MLKKTKYAIISKMKVILDQQENPLAQVSADLFRKFVPEDVFVVIDLGSGGLRADFVHKDGSSLLGIRCNQYPLKMTRAYKEYTKLLTDKAIDATTRFFETLQPFWVHLPDRNIITFATEAVRAAPNKALLINSIRGVVDFQRKPNLLPEILSGTAEAKLIGQSACENMNSKPLFVIHIGGGSVDFFVPCTNEAMSYPKTDFFNNGQPCPDQLQALMANLAPNTLISPQTIVITGGAAKCFHKADYQASNLAEMKNSYEAADNKTMLGRIADAAFYELLQKLYPEIKLHYGNSNVREAKLKERGVDTGKQGIAQTKRIEISFSSFYAGKPPTVYAPS